MRATSTYVGGIGDRRLKNYLMKIIKFISVDSELLVLSPLHVSSSGSGFAVLRLFRCNGIVRTYLKKTLISWREKRNHTKIRSGSISSDVKLGGNWGRRCRLMHVQAVARLSIL